LGNSLRSLGAIAGSWEDFMTKRFIAPLFILAGLLVTTTVAHAQSTTVKSSKSNTSDRVRHGDNEGRPTENLSMDRKGAKGGSNAQPAGRDGSMWVGGDFGAKKKTGGQPSGSSQGFVQDVFIPVGGGRKKSDQTR
jgi:hypothetical protein